MSSIYHYLRELTAASEVAGACYTVLFTMTIQLENRRGNCTVANWVRSTSLTGARFYTIFIGCLQLKILLSVAELVYFIKFEIQNLLYAQNVLIYVN